MLIFRAIPWLLQKTSKFRFIHSVIPHLMRNLHIFIIFHLRIIQQSHPKKQIPDPVKQAEDNNSILLFNFYLLTFTYSKRPSSV
jgi:hypothetical protein